MPRPKRETRDELLADTRSRLLQAAAEEIAREGFVGANINRIARAAGYAKGTIYNYFPSKRALMEALIDEVAGDHYQYVAERVLAVDEPRRRLERFFEAGFDFVIEHLPRARAMVVTLYGPDAAFNTALFDAYQPMFQLVAEEILTPGIAAETLRPVDAYQTAVMLMTIYLGTASQVDDQGHPWLPAGQVAEFALNALSRAGQPPEESTN
jgi:AcrR family transcriptional regulator